MVMTLKNPNSSSPGKTHYFLYNQHIPIQNIWLLMLYASEVFQAPDMGHFSFEKNPDEIPDLVAELLCGQVKRRMKRQLSHAYLKKSAQLQRVRGQIDLLETQRKQLLQRGKIACQYDELSSNTPRNCYIRSALETLSTIVKKDELRATSMALARSLWQSGVRGPKPSHFNATLQQFGRHDMEDRPLLALAELAFNLAIPRETSGKKPLPRVKDDGTWSRMLFEKAVRGFYQAILSPKGWSITSRSFNWTLSNASPEFSKHLPAMRTDIELINPEKSHLRIIDTKFTRHLIERQHGNTGYRSSYIYQIYAYLRSRESLSPLYKNASGMLLHPSIDGKESHESGSIDGHQVHIVTIDLTQDAQVIRQRLLDIAFM